MRGIDFPVAAEAARAAAFEWQLAWSRSRRRSVLLLYLLPLALAVVVFVLARVGIVTTQGSDALTALVSTVFVQFLVAVVPLVFGTGLVAHDAEARTLVYLLVRPLSRASLLAGKFCGAWAAATVLLLGSLASTAAVLLAVDGFAGAGPWARLLPRVAFVLALGTWAYGALFALVGLVFARPALWGLGIAFGWETAIPFLPGSLRLLTVRHHLAAFLPSELLPPFLRIALDPPAPPFAFAWLALGSVAALGGAIAVFARRDYP